MKCTSCANSFGLTAIGNCKGCGSMISSCSDTYCDQCSTTKAACAGCGKSMAPKAAVAPDAGSGAPVDSDLNPPEGTTPGVITDAADPASPSSAAPVADSGSKDAASGADSKK